MSEHLIPTNSVERVAIVAPANPQGVVGGAERAWNGLAGALNDSGRKAEIVALPVDESSFVNLVAGYKAFAELDVSRFDTVVTSKYPAWMVEHPHHLLWMFHPLRGLYDTYHCFGLPRFPPPELPSSAQSVLHQTALSPQRSALEEMFGRCQSMFEDLGPDDELLSLPGPLCRRVVHWLDRVSLDRSQIARHSALSRTIAARADYLPPGVGAHIAYAPSDLIGAEEPADGSSAPYLFTASRLDRPKRIGLLVEAMALVRSNIRLLIGGDGPERASLEAAASPNPRVKFLGTISDDELGLLYRGARAVPFVPEKEDYGLIAVEAMALGVPVLTVTDSGGPTELITHGHDGLVVDPTPAALAAAIDALAADPDLSRRLGSAARERAERITWPRAIRAIFGPATPNRPRTGTDQELHPARGSDRAVAKKIVALTTFRIGERKHGGQLRHFHLYGSLPDSHKVEFVTLTPTGPAGPQHLAPGLIETAVPISSRHQAMVDQLSIDAGATISDLVAGSHIHLTPAYLEALRQAAADADVISLAQPYMYPALVAAGIDLPFIYESCNLEVKLKADILPNTPGGRRALDQITALETEVSRGAVAITACSGEDAQGIAELSGRSLEEIDIIPNGTACADFDPPNAAARRLNSHRWRERYRDLHGDKATFEHLGVYFASWHPPNLDGAEAIMACAPELPHVLFVMGGSHGLAFADRTDIPPNVAFVGVLDDGLKDTLLISADVAINPVRLGSGTNLKVIEYMAAGAPVASTAFGVRGLGATDDVHLIVNDRIGHAIGRVLSDHTAAEHRARAALNFVRARFDWPQLSTGFRDVIDRVT